MKKCVDVRNGRTNRFKLACVMILYHRVDANVDDNRKVEDETCDRNRIRKYVGGLIGKNLAQRGELHDVKDGLKDRRCYYLLTDTREQVYGDLHVT